MPSLEVVLAAIFICTYDASVLRANAAPLCSLEVPRIALRQQKLACARVDLLFWRHKAQIRQAQHARNVRVVNGVETAVAVYFKRENSAHVRVMHDTVLPHCAVDFARQVSRGIDQLVIATARVLFNRVR